MIFATHSMGADMSYQCLGGNNYKIRITFYRDCAGIPEPFFCVLNISSASCGLQDSIRLFKVPGTGNEITPICPSQRSTCNGGQFTGIEEWVYEGIYTFPAQCNDWQLVYEQCCRNGAITTIRNPLQEEMYIFAHLNNTLSPCNNSPTFSNKPVPFVCMGQQFCFNHGAYDPDGDSLSYSLITPISYFGQPVNYRPPYNAYQPLNSIPAMTFDSRNGDFCITPQSPEVTVMAVLVNEYRNGILIGSVERDIQITVLPCLNNLPLLSGINGTGSYTATICADAPFCFDIFSNDPDTGQHVSISWDHAIPAANISISGFPHANGTFCWTPTQTDAGGTPHCFTATVTDDACPYIGTQIFAYCLTVLNVSVDAGPDQTVTCAGVATIQATGNTSFGSISYHWDNGSNSAMQNAGPGTYTVTATNGSCTATDVVQVLPVAGPLADFNAPPVCESTPTFFRDQSSVVGGSLISWSWDFGDGTYSTLQNPIHQYSGIGSYNVCMVVSSSNNCSDTVCKTVFVNSAPVASFTTNNACQGTSIAPLNSTNNSSVTSYSWDFGNGTYSNLQSPVANYPNPGNYVMTLTVSDAIGCSGTLQQPVVIYQAPHAMFSAIPATPCQDGLINFTDQSSGNITAWNWDFGNNQTSSIQNPVFAFSIGTYDVTLSVLSTDGCTDTITIPVTIGPPFSAGIDPPGMICLGDSILLNAYGGSSYSWNNGQTGSSVIVSPAVSSTYVVSVYDINGCMDTASIPVTVLPLPVVTVSADQSICYGDTVTLNASGAVNYSWLPSRLNSQSISVSPPASSMYIVTGTDAYGCMSRDSVNVTVNLPLPIVLNDEFVCPGDSAAFDAGYPGQIYYWSTGETSQSIYVSTAGIYSVVLTDQNGCTSQASAGLAVGNVLINNASSEYTCMGQSVLFDAGNPGSNYLWSTGQTTQTISVASAGNYTVIVTGIDGCTISFQSVLTLNPVPEAAFSANSACNLATTFFTDHSTIPGGNSLNYNWDLGDGSFSSIQNPTHIYTAGGNYTATLIVSSDSGCTDTISSIAVVYPLPLTAMESADICLGDTAKFTDSSTISNDILNIWNWEFGDGAMSSSRNTEHCYLSAGSFNVSLAVTSIHGCTDTVLENITVHPLPVADAGPDTVICPGTSIDIGQTSLPDCSYRWNPSNHLSNSAASTTAFSAINNSLAAEEYNYLLTVIDQYGCSDTSSILIKVLPTPSLTFNAPAPQCLQGNLFTFSASGYMDNNSHLLWDFGNDASPASSSSALPVIVHYTKAGQHPVILNYSFSGCPGIPAVDTLLVWEMPLTGFLPSPAEGCVPLRVDFNAMHPDIQYEYTWQIEGQISHEINPAWTFVQPGNFEIILNVRNENGCVAPPVKLTEIVHPLPEASFVHSPEITMIYEPLIEFQNLSSGAGDYKWDFGDGETENFFEGPHVYSETGTFYISLVVTTPFGCKDTANGKVIIEDGFSFYVPNAVSPNDDGVNDFFQGYGTFLRSYEMSIYDRWGILIYHTNDYDKPWDCKINSVVQNDTYVYRIVVSDSKENSHVYVGSVTVVK